MSPEAGWYLGSRGSRDLDNPMGGFGLGGVNTPFNAPASTVASPSAGVSGSTPGQPAASSEPSEVGSTPAASTPEGNANVTGFNGDLASTGFNFATMLGGLPSLGPVVASAIGGLGGKIAGMIANMGVTAGKNAALGAAPSDMSTNGFSVSPEGTGIPSGTPVTYSGNFMGLPTGSLIGNVASPSVPSTAQPDDSLVSQQGRSVEIPSMSPNMGLFSGPESMGFPSTYGGMASGVATGIAGPSQSDFGGKGDQSGPPGDPGNTGNPSDSGIGPGTGTAPGGSDTGDGGPSGDGVGGDGSGMRRGGPVRPSPKRLSAKLKAGSKVKTGDDDDKTDDVPVRLTKGEFVVNKKATQANEPLLRAINAGKGGMNVGRRA